MATLSYDVSVLGASSVRKALTGWERDFDTHNKRIGAKARGRARGPVVGADGVTEETREARLLALRNRYHNAAVAYHKKLETTRHRDKLRNIEREKQAEINAAKQANARRAAAGRAMRGAVGGAAIQSVGSIGRGALALGAMGSTAIIASGVAKQLNVSKAATGLANKAFGTPGETRSREQIQTDILSQSKQIGDITGDRAGVIEALDRFVAISGNLAGGQRLAGFMANISDATGANMADVGQTGGQILQNIMATRGVSASDTEGMNQALRDTQSIMLAMAGQAKVGSIEFSDLATQMGKVMSSTARFGGEVDDLANQMGAIAQLAIAGGASSPEEAMTSIMRFSDDLIQNAKRFDRLAAQSGIKGGFFADNGKTKLRDPTAIMMDIMNATKGDLTKVKKVFGIRAMKAVEPFQQSYVAARERGMTHEQAIGQVQTTIDRFKGAKMTMGEVSTSAAFARKQTGRSFQAEWERLTQQVGEDLTPALRDLLPSLRELSGSLRDGVPYVKWFFEQLAANPLGTIGKVLAAKVAMDVGRAAIGQAISSAITGQIAASGVAQSLGGVSTAATGAKGGLMAFAGPLGVAAAAVIALNVALNEMTAGINTGTESKVKRGVEGTNLVNEAKARLRSGQSLTEEQRTALTQYSQSVGQAEQQRDAAMGRASVGGVIQTLGASIGLAEGPGVMGTMAALSGGPSSVDVENQADIETILKLDAAAQKSTDAAANQERAAIELAAAAQAIKTVAAAMHRGDQPAPPVK